MDLERLRIRSEIAIYSIYAVLGLMSSLPLWGVKDFGSFYASGEAVAQGQDPYGIYPLTYHVASPSFSGFNQNLNPPTLLPLFEALSSISVQPAFLLWWAVSIICLGTIFLVLRQAYRDQFDTASSLWLLSLGATWDTLSLGQVYLPLALMSCGAWVLLKNGRSDVLAGLLIGALAAFKPNFLVWPALLFLSRHYRCSFSAGAAFAGVVGVSLVLYGPAVYSQWFDLLASDGARAVFPTNGSLVGFFARIEAPEAGRGLSLMLLAAAALWAWVARPGALQVSGCALVISLLASPIAWGHYALFLVPIIVSGWKERRTLGIATTILLSLPLGVAAAASWDLLAVRLTVGSLYFWAFLAVLVSAMKQAGVAEAVLSLASRLKNGPGRDQVSIGPETAFPLIGR